MSIDMTGFKQPASPMAAFQAWLQANSGNAQPVANTLGSGVYGLDQPIGSVASPTAIAQPRSIMDSFLQQRNADGTTSGGYGQAALGALQGIGGLYLGMQQYNLAKDALATNKAQFDRNYAAQKTTTNSQLEDRQRARVASNAGAYQSVSDYMKQNGVM
jgi:hypothetical protein